MPVVWFCLFTGYIQRCVIIQRDDKGYGLTVRGDNPVYVESVKAGNLMCMYTWAVIDENFVFIVNLKLRPLNDRKK